MMPDTSPRAATSGPRTQRRRPGDLTGVRSQQLAADRDKAQEDAAAAAAASKVQERVTTLNTIVDYTQGGITTDEVTQVDVPDEPHAPTMVIRVNYPIEEMTFGRAVLSPPVLGEHGEVLQPAVLGGLNTYEFKEGVQYEVPWELGMHLKDKGYVYDF